MDTHDYSASSPEQIESAAGSDAAQPALAAGGTVPAAEPPRLVIRGENPSDEGNDQNRHSVQPNPAAAFVDWLNFSFPFVLNNGDKFRKLDLQFSEAFGFGFTQNRQRKHLNYEESWVLGDDYGIFATGGNSVAGTSFVSLSGTGCSAVKSWTNTYYLLQTLNAKITRIDLAHDDFLGRHGVLEAKSWWEDGRFNAKHGRPPLGRLIDDLGSNLGKTFYLGNRKSGKLLRVYEKGKQLGKALSPWVRWEVELHNIDRNLKLEIVISPGTHLAGAYPCLAWIYQRQSRIETTRETLAISLDVLLKHCSRSYGKLIWTLREGLGWTDEQIVKALAVEGMPRRLNAVPVIGEASPGGGRGNAA